MNDKLGPILCVGMNAASLMLTIVILSLFLATSPYRTAYYAVDRDRLLDNRTCASPCPQNPLECCLKQSEACCGNVPGGHWACSDCNATWTPIQANCTERCAPNFVRLLNLTLRDDPVGTWQVELETRYGEDEERARAEQASTPAQGICFYLPDHIEDVRFDHLPGHITRVERARVMIYLVIFTASILVSFGSFLLCGGFNLSMIITHIFLPFILIFYALAFESTPLFIISMGVNLWFMAIFARKMLGKDKGKVTPSSGPIQVQEDRIDAEDVTVRPL
jgi:hypothetical protein